MRPLQPSAPELHVRAATLGADPAAVTNNFRLDGWLTYRSTQREESP
jgi:hypothetical protein